MIFLFLISLAIGTSCCLWGYIGLRISGVDFIRNRHDENVADDATDVVFSCVWLGVAVLGAMLTASALFGTVSIYAAIICLVLPCIVLLIRPFRNELWNLLGEAWRKLYTGPTAFIVPLAMLALVSFLGSQPIIYFDTAYYHLPLAQIFETFGALKGLVALHPNFGQTSTWFAIAAPGTVGGELGWGVPTANTALAGIAALHASVGFLKCTKGEFRSGSLIVAIAFPLVLALASRWGMVASISPDLPIMLIVVALAWTMTLREIPMRISTSLVLIACAIGIKLSAAPLGLVGATALLVYTKHAVRPATVSFVLGCAIVVPAIAIGVLASGCAAYPVNASCISTPWTPSAEALAYQTQLILSSARAGGNWLATAHSTSEIIQIWILRDRSGAFVVISAFLAAGLGIVHYFLKGRFSNAPRHENLIWPLYIAVIGTIYVAVTAPTGRFMGGYAAVAVAIVVCCFFPSLVRAISPKVRYTLLAVCVIGVVSLLYSAPHQNLRDMIRDRVAAGTYPDTGSGFLVPHRVIPINLHRPESVPLTKWRRPSQRLPDVAGPEANTECWAAPPPCVPQFSGGKAAYLQPQNGAAGGFKFSDRR